MQMLQISILLEIKNVASIYKPDPCSPGVACKNMRRSLTLTRIVQLMFSTLIQCDLIFLLTCPPLILLREILYHSFLDLLDAGKLTLTLPREENILNPDPECPSCGGTDFRQIGEDCSELLEYIKSSLKVIRNIRPRCVCTKCDKIVQADATPPQTLYPKVRLVLGY